jgi:iron complex transport system ATP-binding protein
MLTQVQSVVRDNRCALIALHDLTLAARFCDRVLMLSNGRLVAQGKPEAVITEENLATYFYIRAKVRWEPDIGGLVVLPCQPIANHSI